jgi:peptidyl-prolyl cis-trans isomerase B (cyclophilin B)
MKRLFLAVLMAAGALAGLCQEQYAVVTMRTSLGTMKLVLHNETPAHRDNFLKLAGEKFFDGILFHRVIKNFMIQAGDPYTKDSTKQDSIGNGGPGYTVPAEFVPSLFHRKGALAAAREGDDVNPERRSSGSQFYIVQGIPLTDRDFPVLEQKNYSYSGNRYKIPEEHKVVYREQGGTPHLDMHYTVFGQVISGFDVIDKIAAVEVDAAKNHRPLKPVTIEKVRVRNYSAKKFRKMTE